MKCPNCDCEFDMIEDYGYIEEPLWCQGVTYFCFCCHYEMCECTDH